MLKIIDLQVGNIGSVIKAVRHVGAEYEVITSPTQLDGATKIILPGVGNFKPASQRLFDSGFAEAIKQSVIVDRLPILGICVGMQLLANWGEEGGGSAGLGFFDAVVKRVDDKGGLLNVPHMGWNEISFNETPIFSGISNESCVYFVHSFAMKLESTEEVNVAYTDYGEDVVAYVGKDNIHGAQFHPEKSQAVGLKFIRNFIELC